MYWTTLVEPASGRRSPRGPGPDVGCAPLALMRRNREQEVPARREQRRDPFQRATVVLDVLQHFERYRQVVLFIAGQREQVALVDAQPVREL